jgi:heterotetrameric sarcosine oxidase gamma subunit
VLGVEENVAGVELAACAADIVELAALRGRTRELEQAAIARGVQLPPLGRVAAAPEHLVLAVRPERWLMLTVPAAPGSAASAWPVACSGIGAAIDLSSGLAMFHLAGPAARAALARGCRLDLHPQSFPAGRTAATLIAQVSVILAALPSGWLLLAPSTLARHAHEWLASVGRPFGLRPLPDLTLSMLLSERTPRSPRDHALGRAR